jgi:hypothetical protein
MFWWWAMGLGWVVPRGWVGWYPGLRWEDFGRRCGRVLDLKLGRRPASLASLASRFSSCVAATPDDARPPSRITDRTLVQCRVRESTTRHRGAGGHRSRRVYEVGHHGVSQWSTTHGVGAGVLVERREVRAEQGLRERARPDSSKAGMPPRD